ncbi:MAG: hypothetical protein CNLJKLNK_00731 [Holosporales bacterium]
MMHPLLSLGIVLLGIVFVVYILSFFKAKNKQSFCRNDFFKMQQIYSIDPHYKIVLLKVGSTEKLLLLGPTTALELSYETQDKMKSAAVESTGCTDRRD